jgi:hypothetical protein
LIPGLDNVNFAGGGPGRHRGAKKPWQYKQENPYDTLKRYFHYSIEAVSKCSVLFKIKEGENFNHRNTLRISRIKM